MDSKVKKIKAITLRLRLKEAFRKEERLSKKNMKFSNISLDK
jgi:hypothetical protein